jgi:hypothetical protein
MNNTDQVTAIVAAAVRQIQKSGKRDTGERTFLGMRNMEKPTSWMHALHLLRMMHRLHSREHVHTCLPPIHALQAANSHHKLSLFCEIYRIKVQVSTQPQISDSPGPQPDKWF